MTVNLKYHGIGRFSEPAFSIADTPLELNFEGIKGLSGEFIFVYRINDRPQKKLTLKGYKTAIPLNELMAGQLDGKIIHCVRGVKVSEYDIEPLVLKDIEGKFYAHGMLSDIENTITGLTETARKQEERITILEKTLTEELEIKRRLLEKLNEYVDNGVNVTFEE
jgi:hypothetical protein